jgi:hypothetical protein
MTPEDLDILVVRPMPVMRISHSMPLIPMEWAAEQAPAYYPTQPEKSSRPSNFARFAQHISLTRGTVSTTLPNFQKTKASGRA